MRLTAKPVYKHPNTGGMMETVRWNIAVSPDTDQSVRMFIAAQGGGRKGDLSRFIEEAVRSYLLEKAVVQAKNAASGVGESALTDLIDEAVHWARAQ
jgi:tripartite-type tricarboxylate transporter receptor subunit TctC